MFKSKEMIRRLAMLLCLALVIGILPVGVLSTPVPGNAVPTGNLLTNGGFEEGTAGWKWCAAYSSYADDKHSGEKALQIADESDAAGYSTKQVVAVEAGKTYKVSAWVKILSGKGGYIGVYGISNPDAVSFQQVDGWQEYSLTITIPEGENQAEIEFGAHKGQVVTYLIDDVVFEEVVEEPEDTEPSTEATEPSTEATEPSTEATEPAVSNPVVNGGFENGTANWKWCAVYSSYTDDKHSGEKALKIADETDGNGYSTKQVVTVEGGKIYNVSVWTKILSGSGGYLAASGTDIAVLEKIVQSGEWAQKTITIVVPEGVTEVEIEIGTVKAQVVTFLVDDVTVEEVVSEPEETEPSTEATEPSTEDTEPATEATEPSTEATEPDDGNLLVNGGFENGTANWKWCAVYSSYTDDKHSGSAALKIADESDAAGYSTKQVVAVEAGKTYKVSAWVKILSGKGGYIGVYGISNPDAVSFQQVDGWQEYSLTITIPEGENQAEIEFGAHKGQVVTFLIDDVTVEEVVSEPEETEPSTEATEPSTEDTEPSTEATEPSTEATEPDDGNLLVNGGFENGTASWKWCAVYSSYKNDKHSGSAALKIADETDGAGYYTTQIVPVEPGKTYRLTAWVRVTEGSGGYLAIFGLGTDVDVLQKVVQEDRWALNSITVTVPEGVTEVTIEVGTVKAQVVTMLVDDMKFREISPDEPEETEPPTEATEPSTEATEPTEPVDPMKPLEEDFETPMDENDLNAGPAGWISNDDVDDVYGSMIALGNDELSHDGNYLLMQMPGAWKIQSRAFPVEVGYQYTAAFVTRKLFDNGVVAGEAQLCFVSASGEVLEVQKVAVGDTYGEWAEASVAGVAPVGAAKAYIVFTLEYNDIRKEGDYAIDSLTVTRALEADFEQGETTPTEPSVPGEPDDGDNTGTGDSVVLLPVFGVMAAVVALAVLAIGKRKFF